jgi:hypothetical protein
LTAASNTVITANSANLTGTTLASSIVNSSLTSVGTLTSLAVTGNITSANVTANHYGNGSGLSSLNAANISGTVPSATLAGTVTTNAQPNINSLGVLSGLVANTIAMGLTNITSAATTTTLTASSTAYQHIIGSTTQTIKMPDETTIPTGTYYIVDNDSSIGNVTLQDSAGSNLATLVPGEAVYIYSMANSAATGNWSGYRYAPVGINWGTTSLNMNGSNIVANIVTANSFSGNGASLTNISAQPIANGTSNVNIPVASGNINFSAAGNANVFVVTGTGANIVGVLNATGNIVSGTGTGGTISGANLVSANYLTGVLTTAAQPNVTSVGTLSSVTVAGNITGTAGYVLASTTTGIVAAGSTQGTATALTTQFNVVSSVAASTGVILPTAVAGMRITVFNTGVNALNVYPATNGIINALSANAAYSVAVGTAVDFCAYSTTQWFTK